MKPSKTASKNYPGFTVSGASSQRQRVHDHRQSIPVRQLFGNPGRGNQTLGITSWTSNLSVTCETSSVVSRGPLFSQYQRNNSNSASYPGGSSCRHSRAAMMTSLQCSTYEKLKWCACVCVYFFSFSQSFHRWPQTNMTFEAKARIASAKL